MFNPFSARQAVRLRARFLPPDSSPIPQRTRAASGILLAVGLTLSLLPAARAGVIYVNPAGPGPEHNGQTWATGFQTLTPAIDAASDGDEVWVAHGVYTEGIQTTKGIRLYGGFDGTETTLIARDPRAHLTVLQGDGTGPVVRFTDVPAGGGLDGFTIRGGLYGVSLEGGAPAITGNVLTANSVAVDALESSPSVSANRVHANFDGFRFDGGAPAIHANTLLGQTRNGIACWDGAAVLRDNAILGCGESGIYLVGGTPTAVNNTVIGCQTGVTLDGATATLTNNLVAWHYTGIAAVGDATGVTLKSNGFFGSRTALSGLADPTGTAGNITADPKLASAGYGNFHLQPDSPMRDAGDDAAVTAGDTDVDGQPRQQGRVDIGADEADGTVWTVTPSIVRVSADTGDDANNGSDWAKPMKTIQAGMDAAMLAGGEVWVAAGTYQESITLRPFAYLYGGFSGSEQARDPIHRQAGGTVLAASTYPTQVKVRGGHTFTLMDGMTVQNGGSLMGSSTTFANNTFSLGFSETNDAATFRRNLFVVRSSGIRAESSSPQIVYNTFSGGASSGIGIYFAISLTGCGGVVANNLITTPDTGIDMVNSAPSILSNTLSGVARGIRYTKVEPVIVNNIINSLTTGITRSQSTATPNIRNNDVFGGTVYSGLPSQTGTNGNISQNPKFRDSTHGNYRLAAGSPGIDAGDDSAVLPGATDLDGKQRIQGAHVDMGAYEYTASQFAVSDAALALRIAAGLAPATAANLTNLDIDPTGPSAGRIDLVDSLRILRNAFGLDAGR